MNKNVYSADVRRLTRATAKAQRKRRSLLKSLYRKPQILVFPDNLFMFNIQDM